MLNPLNWLSDLFYALCEGLILSSYWLCLIGGLVGLILYIFGYKKGKNYPLISIALYLIINIVGRGLLNV